MFLDRQKSDAYCSAFNAADREYYKNDFPNDAAADFLAENIPMFDCPDPMMEEIYYFRWWSFRKHLRSTPFGYVVVEFLPDVPWAGPFNTISCPAEHQINEVRWLKNTVFGEDYIRFWMNPETKAQTHTYTFGAAGAARELARATGNKTLCIELLDALAKNYLKWEQENRDTCGLFFQKDNNDGMEYSIGGSGYRATINSCMANELYALADFSRKAGRTEDAAKYQTRADKLRNLINKHLWNNEAQFFMNRRREDFSQVDVRELHGYTPWYYFPAMEECYDPAWKQLTDTQGFAAPYGPTTAEQRHPQFNIDKVVKPYSGAESAPARRVIACRWDGPSWPFATSVTLKALANHLRDHKSRYVTERDYFDLLHSYFNSQYIREDGKTIPWIDENLDPYTGEWLAREILKSYKDYIVVERGKDYSHSTSADLVITGLLGLMPEVEDKLQISPLIPENIWDYFLMDEIPFRGHLLTLQYDKDGSRYGRGAGFTVYSDGREIARLPRIGTVTAEF